MGERIKAEENDLLLLRKALKEVKLPSGETIELEEGGRFYAISITSLEGLKEEEIAKIRRKIEAKELVNKAQEQAKKHRAEGWSREDFKKDFVRVHEKITNFVSNQEHETGDGE